MIVNRKLAANHLLFFFTTLLLVGFQSSLWMQIFGYFPSPQLWVPCLAYWSIYRHPSEGATMCLYSSLVASSYTVMSFGLLFFVTLLLYVIALAIKQRIYWNGATYVSLLSGFLVLVFPFAHFFLSLSIEKNPITDPQVIDWIISALFTALLSMPLFLLYSWFDTLTEKELPTEAGQSIYE